MAEEIIKNKTRKVFLDHLPKWGKNKKAKEGTINWKESLGHKVNFIYDDIQGEFLILDYDSKKNGKLSIKYLDDTIFKITPGHLKECKLKEMLGLKTVKYKYNIGEILENKTGKLKILNQIRISSNSKFRNNRTDKGYEYKCLECGNTDLILEGHIIEGKGCNVCCASPQKIVKGINDIATTHPHIVKYFENKDEVYIYTIGSNVNVNVICDQCGHKKCVRLYDLCRYGIACPKCGDGNSYPNKFIFELLSQLKLNFKVEKKFKWSNNKRYDFYINNFKCIIEAHGEQHYKETNIGRGKGRNLNEEQENDTFKEQLAKENGIENYLIIDCRKSELEFIKTNILKSKLTKLFDLSKIDWIKCHEYACNNLVKVICELWNEGLDIKDICKKTKFSNSTILKHLNHGVKLGWCDYKTVHERRNEKIFKVCELWNNGVKNPTKIGDILNINRNNAREYLKEGYNLKICDYTAELSRKYANNKRAKSVLCLDNGIIFESVKDVEDKSIDIFNVKLISRMVSDVCNGKLNQYKGYHFQYIN